jgi:hypothetical protein
MTATEDRLRAAFTARAEQVTHTDLTPLAPPVPTSTRPRRAMPLAAAAAAAAVIAGGVIAVDQASDRGSGRLPAPGSSQEPAPGPSQPAQEVPQELTRRLDALGVQLTVPDDWRVVVGDGARDACVAPPDGRLKVGADDVVAGCQGVVVTASGDASAKDSYKREVCEGKRVKGPESIELKYLMKVWHSEYAAGCRIRHDWWLDHRWSVRTSTPELSMTQQAVASTARTKPAVAKRPAMAFDVDGDGRRDQVRAEATPSDVTVIATTSTAGEMTGQLVFADPQATVVGVVDLDRDGKAEILVRVDSSADGEVLAVFRQDGQEPRLVPLVSAGRSANPRPFLLRLEGDLDSPVSWGCDDLDRLVIQEGKRTSGDPGDDELRYDVTRTVWSLAGYDGVTQVASTVLRNVSRFDALQDPKTCGDVRNAG